MEKENILNKTMYDFSKGIEIMQAIILGLIALLVPTFLAKLITTIFGAGSVIADNSQLIVGSVVNTALIVAAINLKGWKKIVGIVTMPSVSTILSGVLIYAYKKIMVEKKKNYFLAGVVGVILKVLVIFAGFELLNVFGVFPQKLVGTLQTAMSTTQAITATIGVLVTFVIYQIEKHTLAEK